MEQETSYLDAMAGEGLDELNGNALSMAYLSMVQPDSTASETHEPGTWRNTATDENYGKSVNVICVGFKTVWTERESISPFMTVGRYEPNSIEVQIEMPKPGTRGFPKMTNPQSGNRVEELFIYACTLVDHPEAGVQFFSPTVGSMKACKQWNRLLRSQRLPSGVSAPIFSFEWELFLDLVPNPNQPKKQVCKFVKAVRGKIVPEAWFIPNIKPVLGTSQMQNLIMIAAPETSGEAEDA